jgi:glutamyl-tRNA synthetase
MSAARTDPIFSRSGGPLYDAALRKLLETGFAYRDFEPAQETQRQREEAEREKRVYISSRDSLLLSEQQIAQKLADNVPCVIRLKVPRSDTVVINDHVRGTVEWDCSLMPDPVIARSDGSPLYNFATVVDDAAMRITHVIRAEEHSPTLQSRSFCTEPLATTLLNGPTSPMSPPPAARKRSANAKSLSTERILSSNASSSSAIQYSHGSALTPPPMPCHR